MKRKIKVIQIGCGKMSSILLKYAIEKNCEIVGAIDCNPELIGKDLGELLEIDPNGIIIKDSNKIDMILKETKPDIAILTTMILVAHYEYVPKMVLMLSQLVKKHSMQKIQILRCGKKLIV